MYKKIISSVLALCLVSAPVQGMGFTYANAAGTASSAALSGKCGDENSDISWTLDENGTLTISGKGRMQDFANISGKTAPWDRSAVKAVVIGKGVTYIGSYAFYFCKNLASVSLPDTLTGIGSSAFSGGDYYSADAKFSLTSIKIPSSVTYIGSSVFENLTSLEEVTLPENAAYYGAGVFDRTPWYEALQEKAGSDPLIIGNVLFDITSVEGDYTVPSDIVSIAGNAAAGNAELTGITFGSGVKFIGESAFLSCDSLTSVTVPQNVELVGQLAFYGKKLEAINVDTKNKNYISVDGVLLSKDKTHLVEYPCAKKDTSYTVPSTVKTIDEYAFCSSSQVKEITLPEGLETIGKRAFAACTSLQEIVIPDSVTDIGEYAFRECSSMKKATIGSGIETLPEDLFFNCTGMTSVVLPDTLKKISNSAFSWCRSLESIEIPDSVETIEEQAFWCCLALKSLKTGSGLKTIGDKAFYQCGQLENISLNEGLESIGQQAFFECTSVKEIVIPSTVTNLADLSYSTSYSTGIFDGCTSLEKADVRCGAATLGNYIFNNCTSLKTVLLPDTMTRIGTSAFSGCTSLEEIGLPESLKYINSNAFKGCTGLKEIVLPDKISSIGASAFADCSKLENIEIPASLRTIGAKAFSGCTSLSSVYIPETVTSIGDEAFIKFGTDAKYTYDLYVLSPVSSDIYTHVTYPVFIKTENPDPASFSISAGMNYTTNDTKYDDIDFTGNDGNKLRSVEGGYIWNIEPENTGTFSCMVLEKDEDSTDIAAVFDLTINDYDTAYDAWMDDVISSNTTEDMTNFEKMSAVSSYLYANFKYLTNDGQYLLTLASDPNGPYFAAHHWDSYISPSALCNFALRIGGFDKVDSLYSNYAQYGYSWSNGHYLCYCEAGGEGKFYQACPLASTGGVDVTYIDLSDDSQLYPINGYKKNEVNYEPVKISGKTGSKAESFALANDIEFIDVSFVKGDANGDGSFTTDDAALLQKYILGDASAKIVNYEAADLTGDGIIDVFDLILIKQQTVQS